MNSAVQGMIPNKITPKEGRGGARREHGQEKLENNYLSIEQKYPKRNMSIPWVGGKEGMDWSSGLWPVTVKGEIAREPEWSEKINQRSN